MGRGGQGRRHQAGDGDPRAARVHRVVLLGAPRRGEDPSLSLEVLAGPARTGHLGIFDRSYYGRVLVERVEGFCSEEEWKRAYREINEFEGHQASIGMVIRKFWLHISPEEQLRRFRDRERDPFRAAQAHRGGLAEPRALEGVRGRGGGDAGADVHPAAPWTVVEADDKLYARVKVLKTMTDALEEALGR